MNEVTKPCMYCGQQAQYDESYCYECSMSGGQGGHATELWLRSKGMSQRHIDQFMRRVPPHPTKFYDPQ